MDKYLSTNFPNLIIKSPLFYSWLIGIRFQIGPEDIPLWKNRDDDDLLINEPYFKEALTRANSIFDLLFDREDELIVLYQIYSDGRRKIKKKCFLFNQIESINTKEIIYTDEPDLYIDEDEEQEYKSHCWKRAKIALQTKDINVSKVLNAQLNTDFLSRGFSLKGECYFINKTKNLILYLYDDRGMDVIAKDKYALMELYATYNHWILDSDKSKIDRIFNPESNS